MPEDEEPPRWSLTWLFRVQRTGRTRRAVDDDDVPRPRTFWKAVPWIIMLALAIEIAIGVWLDLLPR